MMLPARPRRLFVARTRAPTRVLVIRVENASEASRELREACLDAHWPPPEEWTVDELAERDGVVWGFADRAEP